MHVNTYILDSSALRRLECWIKLCYQERAFNEMEPHDAGPRSARRLTYLRGVGPAEGGADPHHVFDALHFLLVAVAVLHGALLGLLQRTLQRLDSVGRGPKTFLQLRKLAAKIRIVTHQLTHAHRKRQKAPEVDSMYQ